MGNSLHQASSGYPPAQIVREVTLGGVTVRFETGRIARQADAAIVVRSGDNVLLATVAAAKRAKPDHDFLPLTVDYREKFASVGRIPGSFGRRETRATEAEVLTSRLIDRTLRSLFPVWFRVETQVLVTVLSANPDSDLTSLALLGATAAVHLSSLPAAGPAAGVRCAMVDGSLVALPTERQRNEADLQVIVSAGPKGIVMVEAAGQEVNETVCVDALRQSVGVLEKFQAAFTALREQVGKPKQASPPINENEGADTAAAMPASMQPALDEALAIPVKQTRHDALRELEAAFAADAEDADAARKQFSAWRGARQRERILSGGPRLDGRGPDEIRPIWSEVGWLPRAHGSAIFTRGETQALVTVTLGSDGDAQRIESLHGLNDERFLLHYAFPPYSVGEAKPMRGPGRREIGHGHLARRGLLPVLPDADNYPFTLRVESEISESNGSSSMATVCGASLAMMHAGVPIARPVAGIAMGLVADGDRAVVLSDILGDEDHLGDMDFKVVGTEQGVTALQLDNKLGGLPFELLNTALDQARRGRLHLLREMASTLAKPLAEPSDHVPRIQRMAIMPGATGALIGTRGANIKAITERTGARVSVQDDGTVTIFADGPDAARAARREVMEQAGVLKKGQCYKGTVTGVKDFGIFVRVGQAHEGLVPMRELPDAHRDRPETHYRPDTAVVVFVVGADERGRLQLSIRRAEGVKL